MELKPEEEQRLRELATGLVRGIEEPNVTLDRLGFSYEEYDELSETRMFQQMLREAQEEWDGARNTHKRIKLKAAVNVELALPHFYKAMTDDKEPLSSKVKAMEVVSRIAGLGNPEPVLAGNGQFFKLEINLGAGAAREVVQFGVEELSCKPALHEFAQDVLEHDLSEHRAHAGALLDYPAVEQTPVQDAGRPAQSRLFDALPLEEL